MDPAERDECLMAEVVRGRDAHLETLARRHAGPLLTFLVRMVGDRREAERLFEKVLLAAWARRHTYVFPRPFRPWLFKIALARGRATFRRSWAPGAPWAREAARRRGDAADVSLDDDTSNRLEAALLRLPSRERAVLVLRIWGAFTYSEIAEMAGERRSVLEAMMSRALGGLRQALDAPPPDPSPRAGG